MKSVAKLGFTLVVGACCVAHGQSRQIVTSGPVVTGINSQLMVSESALVELDVPTTMTDTFTADVPIDGVWMTIKVDRHSTRSPQYQIRYQDEAGWHDVEPGPVNTFRGSVIGDKDSIVAGGIVETGFEARIMMNGENYWIEPAHKYSNQVPENAYVVYRSSDHLPMDFTCGCPDHAPIINNNGGGGGDSGTRGPGGDCGGLCVAELACDADTDFFNIFGSVSGVENRINLVISTMNPQYESQVGITHEITTILVRTAEPDPYSSTDANALLTQFQNHWNSSQGAISRDVAELFTGKNISGSVIGIASLGTICTGAGYNVVEHLGSLGCATDLSAHELGHNWSATHTSQTMNAGLTCANNFNSTSISQITNHRNSRSCLSPAETAVATLPFFDDFPSTTIDSNLWSGIDGVVSNNAGLSEPSSPNSLNFQGSDEIRSAFIDTSDRSSITVSYFVQEGGNQNPPEDGEDLIAEYRNDVGQWVEFARELGSGGAESTYTFRSFDLSGDALHDDFRIRFRGVSGAATADNWYVDDVGIDGPMLMLPGPFSLQTPANGMVDVPAAPILFDWTDSANTTSYFIEVASTGSFSSPILTDTVVSSQTTLDGSSLIGGAFYFWRVTASSIDGDLTSATFNFRVDIADETFGSMPLRVVQSDDLGGGVPGTITLAPGVTSAELYVQCQVVDDALATGIVAFDGFLSDNDANTTIDKGALTAEEADIPTPGLDPLGRTGMFPSYRGTIQNDNDNQANGFASGNLFGFVPLNISPTGNGEGLNGMWSNIYKASWSTTDPSPRTVTVEVSATSGGYQRDQADGGLAQPVPMVPGTIDIVLQAGGACPCDLDGNIVVDINDLLAFLSLWFTEDGMSVDPGSGADYTGDGDVNINDLLAFLGCWFATTGGAPCP